MSNIEPAQSTSSVITRKSIENLQHIDLIGKTSHQITGAKLPSNRQVLQVMFYNIRFVDRGKQKDAKKSARLAIDAAKIFWQQARIPMRENNRCLDVLMKLYNDWKNIRKTAPHKRSSNQTEFAEKFIANLDDLFDIASVNALEEIKIVEDKEFLEMQRQKGRPGSMAGVDMVLHEKEKRYEQRREKEEMRKRKHEEQINQHGNLTIEKCFYVIDLVFNIFIVASQIMDWECENDSVEARLLESFDDENETLNCTFESNDANDEAGNSNFTSNIPTKKRGRTGFMTARLAAALDNAKVSDGMAVHILIAAAEALGHRVEDLIINRSSIHRFRQENRSKESKEISNAFSSDVNKLNSNNFNDDISSNS